MFPLFCSKAIILNLVFQWHLMLYCAKPLAVPSVCYNMQFYMACGRCHQLFYTPLMFVVSLISYYILKFQVYKLHLLSGASVVGQLICAARPRVVALWHGHHFIFTLPSADMSLNPYSITK